MFPIWHFKKIPNKKSQLLVLRHLFDKIWPLDRVLFPIIGNFNPFFYWNFPKKRKISKSTKKNKEKLTTSIYNICTKLWKMFTTKKEFSERYIFWFHFRAWRIVIIESNRRQISLRKKGFRVLLVVSMILWTHQGTLNRGSVGWQMSTHFSCF